jgi:hypothetical protein
LSKGVLFITRPQASLPGKKEIDAMSNEHLNKHHLISAIHQLLAKIHLSLANNREEMTAEEQALMELLLKETRHD